MQIETAYPLAGDIRIHVGAAAATTHTIRVRIPGWVTGPVPVAVNGVPATTGQPGSFVSLDRVWHDGDEIRFSLPLALRTEPALDDPGLQALFLGPTLLLARSGSTTAIGAPLWGLRRTDGSLAGAADAGVLAAGESGGIMTAGHEFEPCWSGADARYHMYLRADDATIAFAGIDTGVPNRRRPDGSTFLSSLWSVGAFSDDDAFLDRVLVTVLDVRAEGLLSRTELERVLIAAAQSIVGAPPGAGATAAVVTGAEPARGAGPDGAIVWTVPGDAVAVAPAVTVVSDIEPAPSGWFVSPPSVRIHAADLDGRGVQCRWRLDDGPWQDGTGPIVLADGVHTVDARVVDAGGAVGSASRTFSVDTVAPVSRARIKSLGASVEITLDATDDVSGVERIQWEGPGTFWGTFQEAFVRALTDTEQIIEFAATDRAGNEEPRQRIVLPRRAEE